MIQQFVEPTLAAITRSNHFLHDFISRSHHGGGTLARSLQHRFTSVRFAFIFTAPLRSHCSFSISLRSGLSLDRCTAVDLPMSLRSLLLSDPVWAKVYLSDRWP